MTKHALRFCKDCKFSNPEEHSIWNLKCVNPAVLSEDAWALAHATFNGSECRTERGKRWYIFPKCGMSGKQFEPKNTDLST